MKRIVAAILVVGLTACGASALPPEAAGQTIDGTFVLHAQRGNFAPNGCTGDGGYADIASGMGLTLKDGEGTILATSRLERGETSDDRKECHFAFTFEDVPDADFYVVESSGRGEQTYSRAELKAADWTINLEIGN